MNLVAKNLVKKFGEKVAVDNVNLNIERGKILALLGPNGAGKSTTIKMLSGQIIPTSGVIEIDGKPYTHVPQSYRGSIGVMPQDVVIWDDLNVKENLVYSAQLQGLKKDLILKRVPEMIEALNLQSEINTLARNLSGGFKRRLNLAISIVHNPSLIFLDEPTPGVDPQNRRFLWDYINFLKQSGENSLVLTDHYIEEAEKLADYVVIVDHAKVIAEGTVSELKKKYSEESVVNISFDENYDLEPVKENLEKAFGKVNRLENTLTISTNVPTEVLEGSLKIFSEMKVGIKDIVIKESTLEDVFLNLTGKNIRE